MLLKILIQFISAGQVPVSAETNAVTVRIAVNEPWVSRDMTQAGSMTFWASRSGIQRTNITGCRYSARSRTDVLFISADGVSGL